MIKDTDIIMGQQSIKSNDAKGRSMTELEVFDETKYVCIRQVHEKCFVGREKKEGGGGRVVCVSFMNGISVDADYDSGIGPGDPGWNAVQKQAHHDSWMQTRRRRDNMKLLDLSNTFCVRYYGYYSAPNQVDDFLVSGTSKSVSYCAYLLV